MKTVRVTVGITLLLTFTGLSVVYGQTWIISGNNIYNNNSGNVGVGNTAPATLLHVGKSMTEPTIKIQNFGSNGGATYQMTDNLSGADWKFKATQYGGFKIRDNAFGLDVMTFEANSSANAIYIDGAGDVALSHNAPGGYGLHVINYTNSRAAVVGQDQSGGSLYASGMLGVLNGPGLGLPIYAYNVGVFGIKPSLGANGAAVAGWNLDAVNSPNYGGLFITDGAGSGINYGVYSSAMHAANNFAGKFLGRVEVDGHPSATEAADFSSTVFKAMVHHALAIDTKAVEGLSNPAAGYGIGVQGTGGWMGVSGYADGGAYTGTNYGLYGYAYGTDGTHIGVYGYASGGTTNWAGYFTGDTYISSDLRIATTTQATGYALSVNGKIACTEILVEEFANWPDYVFAEDYNLMSIEELEQSIEENGHLPGLPSAAEVEENGLMLGDIQKRLMEKVEELTLYTIQQGKMINELREKMENLEKENANLRESTSK